MTWKYIKSHKRNFVQRYECMEGYQVYFKNIVWTGLPFVNKQLTIFSTAYLCKLTSWWVSGTLKEYDAWLLSNNLKTETGWDVRQFCINIWKNQLVNWINFFLLKCLCISKVWCLKSESMQIHSRQRQNSFKACFEIPL